jgi:hypothetical protein
MRGPERASGRSRLGPVGAAGAFGVVRALVGVFVVALGLAGCAGSRSAFEPEGASRLHHRRLGYAIDRPAVLDEPGWRVVELDESDFVARHGDGSALALASTCRATKATPRQLAFHLRHASGATPVGVGEDVEQAGLPGYAQALERVEGGAWTRMQTVTLRGARCTYDFILVAPDAERLAGLRPGFEAWWHGFTPAAAELAPAAAGGEGAS